MLRMLVADLDGTLLSRERGFDAADIKTLHALGNAGVVRAIATGRALVTATRVLPPDFPIDYLIFSSGAGIMRWRSQDLLVTHNMQPHETKRVVDTFIAHELDFMLHAPIPEQHLFQFHRTGKPNPDFERRLARYAGDGRALDASDADRASSQLIAISPSSDPLEPFETLRRELSGLSIIRATSPLDDRSMWLEAFAQTVSKSQAAAWIAAAHGIVPEDARALGNDYNDWGLLRWAGNSAVVHGAPASMAAEFMSVASLASWLDIR